MKEQKIKLAIKCLYISALVQLLGVTYSVFQIFQANERLKSLSTDPTNFVPEFGISYFSALGFYPALIVVGSVLVSSELKQEKPWAWLGALGILVLAVPSWAFLAAIVGILSLLDSRVRDEYLKKLDVAL